MNFVLNAMLTILIELKCMKLTFRVEKKQNQIPPITNANIRADFYSLVAIMPYLVIISYDLLGT